MMNSTPSASESHSDVHVCVPGVKVKEKVVLFHRSTLHGWLSQQFSTITLPILVSVEPVVDTCVYVHVHNRQVVLVQLHSPGADSSVGRLTAFILFSNPVSRQYQ